jgi:hypothetical protein
MLTNKKMVLLFLAMTLMLSATARAAEESEDVREQLNILKDEILILQDQLEETNVANANEMKISGYADIEYHNSTASGAEPGFRLHHMSLFFEKRLTDDWKFFSEIEYEDAPFSEFDFTDKSTDSTCDGCYGKIFLEAANFTYAYDPIASFRTGRFFTPAGIWSIDHYPSFVPTQLRPQHIRSIFPQVVDGVAMFGTVTMGNSFLNYDLYLGNGEGNSGKEDTNSDKATGINVSLLLPFFKYFEIGMSAYNDTSTIAGNDTDKSAVGAHMKVKFYKFTFQTEYAIAEIDPDTGSAYDRTGYYAQLLYDIDRWTLGVRTDFYDEDNSVSKESTFNSVFFNSHLNQAVVLKLEHHQVSDDDITKEDYDHTIASIVMYLGN